MDLFLRRYHSKGWKDKLCALYSEPQRKYHTIGHIDSMILDLGKINNICDMDAIILAIVFHDAVYEPSKSDNEERSKDLFIQFALDLGNLNPELVEKVSQMIMATKSHAIPDGVSNRSDFEIFLDLDMAILSSPREQYIKYAHQIRMEYSHLSDDAFVNGRKSFLNSVLSKPSVYFTSNFDESAAKENANYEISHLMEIIRAKSV